MQLQIRTDGSDEILKQWENARAVSVDPATAAAAAAVGSEAEGGQGAGEGTMRRSESVELLSDFCFSLEPSVLPGSAAMPNNSAVGSGVGVSDLFPLAIEDSMLCVDPLLDEAAHAIDITSCGVGHEGVGLGEDGGQGEGAGAECRPTFNRNVFDDGCGGEYDVNCFLDPESDPAMEGEAHEFELLTDPSLLRQTNLVIQDHQQQQSSGASTLMNGSSYLESFVLAAMESAPDALLSALDKPKAVHMNGNMNNNNNNNNKRSFADIAEREGSNYEDKKRGAVEALRKQQGGAKAEAGTTLSQPASSSISGSSSSSSSGVCSSLPSPAVSASRLSACPSAGSSSAVLKRVGTSNNNETEYYKSSVDIDLNSCLNMGIDNGMKSSRRNFEILFQLDSMNNDCVGV